MYPSGFESGRLRLREWFGCDRSARVPDIFGWKGTGIRRETVTDGTMAIGRVRRMKEPFGSGLVMREDFSTTVIGKVREAGGSTIIAGIGTAAGAIGIGTAIGVNSPSAATAAA